MVRCFIKVILIIIYSNCFGQIDYTKGLCRSFDIYNGKIKYQIIKQNKEYYAYYQSDSIRIIIKDKYLNDKFGLLFKNGILHGQMFISENCISENVKSRSDAIEYLNLDVYKNFDGNFFCIDDIKELNNITNMASNRKFEINVVTCLYSVSGPQVFYLELENKKNYMKSLRRFLTGCKIECFKYLYTEL